MEELASREIHAGGVKISRRQAVEPPHHPPRFAYLQPKRAFRESSPCWPA